MRIEENRRNSHICGLQAEGRRFESVNAHFIKSQITAKKSQGLLKQGFSGFFSFKPIPM